jgi:hypothetical protein
MEVDDAVVRLVFLLHLDPVVESAHEVAEVELSRGLNAREHPFAIGH